MGDGLDEAAIRRSVRGKYSNVARSAEGHFRYPTGGDGARALGYGEDLIGSASGALPSFCGVGNPFALGPAAGGAAVLDLGCGGGFDLLVAARRVGPTGRAVGIDLTPEMAALARWNSREASNTEVLRGAAEALPFRAGSFDVVISNGVLNLSPRKERCFAEALRVLRPGGRLLFADIVLKEALPAGVAADPAAWAG